MVDFYGKLVGKYTNPMDAITNIPIRHFFEAMLRSQDVTTDTFLRSFTSG